jgi:hypothetical protein
MIESMLPKSWETNLGPTPKINKSVTFMQHCDKYVTSMWCLCGAFYWRISSFVVFCVVLLKTIRTIGIYRKRSICGTCGAFKSEKKFFLFF